MRRIPVALLAVTAGLTAAAALRRLAGRRRAPAPVAAAPRTAADSAASPDPAAEAVVLPFHRRAAAQQVDEPAVEPMPPASAPVAPAPARCGDSGGLTKAGAPCAGRATAAGRCHHHRVAA